MANKISTAFAKNTWRSGFFEKDVPVESCNLEPAVFYLLFFLIRIQKQKFTKFRS